MEDDYTIRSSDIASALSAIYTGSDVGVNFIFNYFLDNFESITKRYKIYTFKFLFVKMFDFRLTASQISTVLSGVSLRLTRQDQLQQVNVSKQQLNSALSLFLL